MLTKIQPVTSSFAFGIADTLQLLSTSDDLVTTATFSYQLGKMFQQVQAAGTDVPPPIVFIGDKTSSGSVTIAGADYQGWTGGNDAVPALVISQIPGIKLA